MHETKKLGFTIPTAGEDAEQLEHSFTADRNAQRIVVLENNSAASYKVKYTLSIGPRNPASGVFTKRKGNRYIYIDIDIYIYFKDFS